jgi:hypothetical protein
MTGMTERHGSGLLPAGRDRLRELAGMLRLQGLEVRALTAAGNLAGHGEPAAELVVTSPAREREQVRVSPDGAVGWTCRHGPLADADLVTTAGRIGTWRVPDR